MNQDSHLKNSEDKKVNLSYVRNRMLAGSIIGFLLTLMVGYFWACYKHNISLKAGFSIFGHPTVGLGLTVLSFFGAVVGAIVSLFSRRWQEKNL